MRLTRSTARSARPAAITTFAHARAGRPLVAAAVGTMLALAACGGDGGSEPGATTVTVLPNAPSLKIGETVTLVATPKDAGGNVIAVNGPITWSSSTPAVATVNDAGKVTAVAAGTTDVTATIARVSGSTRVTVLKPPVARVDVVPATVTFGRSQTQQLTATMFAADNAPLADRTVTWTTSNTAVVTLSGTTGTTVTITAVAPGNAVVSATSEGVKKDVAVTVGTDPVITFTPASASFGSSAGGGNPPAQTVTVSNGGGGTLSGLAAGAISYTAGQPSGWLTAAFEGGTTAPAPLTLRATTGSLAEGTYTAAVPISSTAPGAASKNLAVTFNIGSAIALGATPANVSFTAPAGSGNPAAQTVNVFSVNGTAIPGLTLGAVEYAGGQPTGWLNPSLSAATTPATLMLPVNVGSLPSGTYTANVPISAPTATNSPLKVGVTLTVPAPLIALSATSRTFTATQSVGTAAGQTVAITNGGRGNLTGLQATVSYAGGPTNWLNVNLSGTTAPATLTLTPVANTIARGTYSATVQISAAGVGNSPQNVGVSYSLVYTFDQHIAGIVQNTVLPTGCSNASCHRSGGQAPVMAAGSGDVYARLLSGYVSAGSPATSLLYQRVSSTSAPMPPAGVNAGIRDAIRDWILDGARRN